MEIDDDFRARSATVTEAVAEEIRAERGRRRVSQTQLADAIGRAQSYVSKRLDGKAPLTLDEFVTICLELRVDPADLLANALRKYHGVVWGSGDEPTYLQALRADGTPAPPVRPRRETSPVGPPSQDDLALAADEGYEPPEDSEVDSGS